MQQDAQALIRAAQDGDEHAFAALYEQYYTPLFRYILARIGDVDVAEDLTQSTFINLFRRLPQNKEPVHLGYFYTAARNSVVDYYRKTGNKPVEASEEVLASLPDPAVDIESEIIAKGEFELVQRALTRLPDDQQEVIVLRFIEGLNGQETAELMGRSEIATRQLQTRALRNLRKLIGTNETA